MKQSLWSMRSFVVNLFMALKGHKFFNYKTILSILLSAAGIYLGFRKFDSRAFIETLSQANLYYFCLSMAVMVLMVYLRAWRWRYLVMPLKKIGMKHLFAATMICYFGNNVFPMRFGEILRSYSLGKMSDTSAVSIFGTVVLERILDLLVFIIIVIITALFFPQMPAWVRLSAIIGVASVVLSGILLFFLSRKKGFLKKYLQKLADKFSHNKLFHTLEHFINGLGTLRETPHIKLIAIQSIVVWTISIANFWLMGASLDTFFSVHNLLLIFFITSAIISVPSAPGYVGTYHAGAIGILLFIGIELNKAQALAVIMHGVGFLSLTSIGLIYFLKYHINIKESSSIPLNGEK